MWIFILAQILGIPDQAIRVYRNMVMIWTATYKSNKIRIVNNWFSGQKLYVNGELQNQSFEPLGNARLTGHLIDPKGYRNRLKVSLHRGILKTKCLLFVNAEEIKTKRVK